MIPLAVPNISPLEHAYVAAALADGHVGPEGPFVHQFEAVIAKRAGRKWAIATITGTAALHACAATLWAGVRGEPVVVGRYAYPAMQNVLTNLGVPFVFHLQGLDHDLATYTRGGICIADRAPALGEPPYLGADVECYSFAANKTFTCGHGGAIVGDDLCLRKAIYQQVVQGYDRPGRLNFRMANFNAALGCAQLDRFDELRTAKCRIWARYRDVGLPLVERGASRWMCTLDADLDLVNRLAAEGIQSRAEPAGVSIPCSTGLHPEDQEEVIRRCRQLL